LDSGWVNSAMTNQYGCDSIVSTYFAFIEADSTFFSTSSCLPSDTGTFITYLTNIIGCDSLIITTVWLEPVDVCLLEATFAVDQPLCFGDSAIVHVDIQTGLEPFQIFLTNGAMNETINYPAKGSYSFKLAGAGYTMIRLTSSNGLELFDTIYINPLSPLEINITSPDHSGWGVPCYGDSNGMAEIIVIESGMPPLSYQWSNGDVLQNISNLSEGIYYAIVTDNNGCFVTDSIIITEPPAMQYEINLKDIICFGDENGEVTLTNITGGVSPWKTSLDGMPFQSSSDYKNLRAGSHQLLIKDQNGCSREETFLITEPDDWHVDLGNDTTIAYGSNFELVPRFIGLPHGMVQLDWSDGICNNCLSRTLEISTPLNLSLLVTDENGCTDEDLINIKVIIDRDLYIPNIFSPNNDQVNDYFNIYSGPLVEEVEELTIFDRWGSMVFQKFHFQPGDPEAWWDGKAHEKFLNPGVYVYKAIIKFKDGVTEVKYGDITLVR